MGTIYSIGKLFRRREDFCYDKIFWYSVLVSGDNNSFPIYDSNHDRVKADG